MEFKTVEEALSVFGVTTVEPGAQEAARRYILSMDPNSSIPQLVDALRSDHFWVRWEAAELLAQMGCAAMVEILSALVDPARVGESRVREGIYHVFHSNRDSYVRTVSVPLQHALHGAAADLETMREADHLLQEFAGC